MRKAIAALATLCLLPLAGCMGPAPLQGVLYSEVRYPSYYDGAAEKGPGSRVGVATMTSYLGMVATGDASVDAAAAEGGISDIRTVDHYYKTILGVIQTWRTEVTGE